MAVENEDGRGGAEAWNLNWKQAQCFAELGFAAGLPDPLQGLKKISNFRLTMPRRKD
jgi:hypothetical protein